MNFNLDFIWILDNKVIDIHKNISPSNSNNPSTISPISAINKILEINAGEIEKM